MELFKYVGERIKQLRNAYDGGKGLSQEGLAEKVGSTANTVSRWETGVYRPSLDDLEQVARVFRVPLTGLFPPEPHQDESKQEEKLSAFFWAAKDLFVAELDELQRYAEYRRLRAAAPRMGVTVRRRKDPE